MKKTPTVETQIYKQQQQQNKTNNTQTERYETEISTIMSRGCFMLVIYSLAWGPTETALEKLFLPENYQLQIASWVQRGACA